MKQKWCFLAGILTFITLSLIETKINAQELPMDTITGKYSFQEVVKVDSTSKDELYSRAREWMAKTFNSAQKAIQMDDKQAGKLIANGSFKSYAKALFGNNVQVGFVNFNITIYLKDQKFKYVFTDFYHEGITPSGGYKYGSFNLECKDCIGPFKNNFTEKMYNGVLTQTSEYIPPLIEDLLKAMKSNTSKKPDDF